MSDTYTSIFFEPGWSHQKYYGWKSIASDKGFRVLVKRQGPVRRALVLASGMDQPTLAKRISDLRLCNPLGEVVLHDFDDAGQPLRLIGGHNFQRADNDQRLLNIATFVVDLAADEASLLQAMTHDCRRRMRKATKEGIEVTSESKPGDAQIAAFLAAYKVMASERGLPMPGHVVLARMFANQDLVLVTARLGEDVLNSLLIYKAGDKGIATFTVGGGIRNNDTGALIHWEAMRMLKAAGLRWFDLGGVATLDDSNGIYRFKKSFGGTLVHLGAEYLWRPPLVRLMRGAVRKWPRLAGAARP